MRHRVLVVGHADADGHLIAEQVRRNLALLDSFEVNVVVDPNRTRDHNAWLHLDAVTEIALADYVFFVDLMFGPSTYPQEAESLRRFVQGYPEKRFFLIDHHPLPLHRLEGASNLHVIYRSDVCECAIGPRSGMMVVAALCEHQSAEVASIKRPEHDTLALGIRRAAARGGPLPGSKLLALLKANQWDELFRLGTDDRQYHRLPRGLRAGGQPMSRALIELNDAASRLLSDSDKVLTDAERESAMPYDTDIGNEELSYHGGGRELRKDTAASSKDLGVIMTLLELAALSLTTRPGTKFTLDQLIQEAHKLSDVRIEEKDIQIVLKVVRTKASFLKKAGAGRFCLR